MQDCCTESKVGLVYLCLSSDIVAFYTLYKRKEGPIISNEFIHDDTSINTTFIEGLEAE
jgi:hypothetical protein